MIKAPLLRRLLAWIIDLVIVGVVIVVLLLCTSLSAIFNLIKDGTSWTITLYSLIEIIQIGLVIEIFLIIYYISIPVRNKGQTFGKKMMKIRIVKNDGQDVDFSTLFLRQAISEQLIGALTFGASLLVGAALALYRKDKKTVSDVFANTKVIFVEEEE